MSFKVGDRIVIINPEKIGPSLLNKIGTIVEPEQFWKIQRNVPVDTNDFIVVKLDNDISDKKLRIFPHDCYRHLTPLDKLL